LRNKTFTKLKYFEELKSESPAPPEIILNAGFYEIRHYMLTRIISGMIVLIRKIELITGNKRLGNETKQSQIENYVF
jgi:hypothetical protein